MPVLTRNGYRRAIAIDLLVLNRAEIRRRNFLAAIGREISGIVEEETIDGIEDYQLDMTRRSSVERLLMALLCDNGNIQSARLPLPFQRLAYIRLYGEDSMNNFVDEQGYQVTRVQQYMRGDAATRLKIYAEVVATKLIDREKEFRLLTAKIDEADRIYADKNNEAAILREVIPRCFCHQPLLAHNFQVTLLLCGHAFHEECITHNYRFYSDTCPNCHHKILLTDMRAGYLSV